MQGWGRIVVTNLISSVAIGLFTFSVSFSVGVCNFCLSRKLSIFFWVIKLRVSNIPVLCF